jgi:hypothetical protein
MCMQIHGFAFGIYHYYNKHIESFIHFRTFYATSLWIFTKLPIPTIRKVKGL